MLSVFFLFTRHLGLDLVPRKDFEVVDSDQISVSDLYKMVRNLTQGKLIPCTPHFFSFIIPSYIMKQYYTSCSFVFVPKHVRGLPYSDTVYHLCFLNGITA